MEMLGNRAGMNVRQKFGAHELGEVACPITGRDFFQFAVFVLCEAEKNHTVSGISSHTHVLQGRVNLLGQGRIGPPIRGEQTDAEGSAPATQMPSQKRSHTRRHPTTGCILGSSAVHRKLSRPEAWKARSFPSRTGGMRSEEHTSELQS